MTEYNIGFAGMTHLGINSAIASAYKGFKTIGFDQDSKLVSDLKKDKLGLSEPGLDDALSKNKSHISFSSCIDDLASCDLIVVSPDIPTDDKGSSDLSFIMSLIHFIDENTPSNTPFIVLSQVPPGFTRTLSLRENRPLFYQVETLIFGEAFQRAITPERIILGCENPEAALPEVLEAFLAKFSCPILPMRYESAELAKISINCCLVSSIVVANTLAEICEQTGADWSEISPALKLDKRIGAFAYLTPGLGISGGNLERDLATISNISTENGTESSIVNSWITNSHYRKNWPLKCLYKHHPKINAHTKITILGLSYKKNTNSVKNSPALKLIDNLQHVREIKVYDPIVKNIDDVAKNLKFEASALEACSGAEAVLIMTDWEEFKDMKVDQMLKGMTGNLIIDPYALLPMTQDYKKKSNYVTLGVA